MEDGSLNDQEVVVPKVCCTVNDKKSCKEFSYTPAGKAAAKRAAKACREKGCKARTSNTHHKQPPSPPTAVTTEMGVQY